MDRQGKPLMEPLAPLVDQLVDIAREEIPPARTCTIKLYDDYTYRIKIVHRYGDGEKEAIVYDGDTGEVYWRDTAGAPTMHIQDPVHPDTTIIAPYSRMTPNES